MVRVCGGSWFWDDLAAAHGLRWRSGFAFLRATFAGPWGVPIMATDQAVRSSRSRSETVIQGQVQTQNSPSFSQYQCDGYYDEMFDGGGQPRPDCRPLYERIRSISADDL